MADLNSIFDAKHLSSELNLVVFFTLLSLIPFVIVAMTTFTRNLIVFSFLRHALGLQQSPPNIVIIVLSLVVMTFTMQPIFKRCYLEGVQPYQAQQLDFTQAVTKTWMPLRSFMVLQTQEKDIAFVHKMARIDIPSKLADVEFQYVVSAFMLSELKLAFKIGFIIFLPFLLIDLVVSAILTSLGMIMVPPTTISLPLKIMLFVVIDGWELITQVLVSSVIT